jgi:hypothetical protein
LGVDVNQLVVVNARFQRTDSAKAYVGVMQREADRLAAIPGVQGAAVSFMGPMSGELGGMAFLRSGDTARFSGKPYLNGNATGPGYFATVGMQVVDGRDFASTDVANAAPVLIVSKSAAQDLWPAERAVGNCLRLNRDTNPCATVVGVVSDANLVNIKPEPQAHYYVPVTQQKYLSDLALTIRAPRKLRTTLAPTARRELASQLPASTTLSVQDLRSTMGQRYTQWTEGAVVFSAMGILALIVAGIGMYSIIAYSVSRRMHEMAVRVALGASRRQVMRPVVFGGLALAVAGVAIGVGIALAAGKLVASLLYETSPRDPLAMLAAAVVLLVAALVASFVPARRAARADPMRALQAE